jgi:choline dehydrogenase-like flavoprotein
VRGEVFSGVDITADVERSCDVCIVGSGAGGAVLAAGLVEAGLTVVMLEAGGYFTKRDFDLNEAHAMPMLYQERGTRGTADQAITVLQGRSVGGSTTVNWTTCFRTPERILDHWRDVHRLEGWDQGTLIPHWEAVERRLGIADWPMVPNGSNDALQRGCEALGWHNSVNRRNVKGCLNSGYCGMGCPVDAKQAMGITYIPDAIEAGMTLFADTEAERFDVENGRVVAVHGRVMERDSDHRGTGKRVIIRPKVVVSSAGGINGPALLMRSGINQGPVGRRTFLHPVVGIGGEYAHRMDPWYGAPQSITSHEFVDRGPENYGIFLEAAPGHPVLLGSAMRAAGVSHTTLASRFSHVGLLIALHVDGLIDGDEGGTVSLRADGRVRLDYPISDQLKSDMRFAHEALAKVHLAAGAMRASTLHAQPVVIESEADLGKLQQAPYGANHHAIFCAHVMGGCAMGGDPARSVVDHQLRHRHVPNLFVVDGSVLPTSLGVNPSQTLYGIAHRARGFVGEAV